jgi:hypothetical protein
MKDYIVQYEGYDIKPHKEVPTNYIVVTSGKGGKIPAMLEGLFTSRAIAKDKIDTYLRSKVKE